MASSEYRSNTNNQGNIVDVTQLETEFKKDKVRAKLNFTRSRNQLLHVLLLEQQDMPSCKGIRDACENMDQCMEIAMEVLSKFSDFYMENKQLQKSQIVVSEMEKIDEDFYRSYESAREYLDKRRDNKLSLSADMLSIDPPEKMNITDHDVSETYRKEKQVTEQSVSYETLPEVGSLDQSRSIRESIRETTEATSSYFQNKRIQNKAGEVGASSPTGDRSTGQIKCIHWADMDQHSQHSRPVSGISGVINEPGLNPNAASFELMESVQTPSIGQDLWRQLKRVQIPVFDGDKRKYQSRKAAFLAFIDSAKQLDETEDAFVPTGTTFNRKAIIDDISAIKNCEIWNARGYSQYTEKGYVRESHDQEQSESKTNLLVIMPGKDSTESGMAIHTSTNMNDLLVNETVHTRPNLQRYLLRYRWSFAAEVFGILERYLRIGRPLAYKLSAYSSLRRGSIQNRPLESKYDRILLLAPSTEIVRIPKYGRKIEAGLAHNRLSSAKMFTGAARGVLLQDTWTTGLEKNDRPVEPSLKLARALSTAIRATHRLEKNWATAHQKLSKCLQKRVSTYKYDIMSLRASTGAFKYLYGNFQHVRLKVTCKISMQVYVGTCCQFEGLVTSKHGRVNFSNEVLGFLVTRTEQLEIAFGHETNSFLNILFKIDRRGKHPEEMFFENRAHIKNIEQELLLVLQLHGNKIEESFVNHTVRCQSDLLFAQHLFGVHGYTTQSSKNSIFALLLNAEINVEEQKGLTTSTEGLIIVWPLTYQSASPPKGVPLVLNHNSYVQIGVQFAETPVDKTKFNIHGRDGAGSWNKSGTNYFIHLYNNGDWDDRMKWHQERRNQRDSEIVRYIPRKLGTWRWPRCLTRARWRISSRQATMGQSTLVTSMRKLSVSIRTTDCTISN